MRIGKGPSNNDARYKVRTVNFEEDMELYERLVVSEWCEKQISIILDAGTSGK